MRPAVLLLFPLLAACAGPGAGAGAAPAPTVRAEPAAPVPGPAIPEAPMRACGFDVERLIADEVRLRPLAEPVDLYKLLHQAVLGPGHALRDPAAARDALARELSAAGPPRPGEPIVEDLDESLGTLRLNLRRYRFVRGTADELWPAVERSAREVGEGDRGRLAACLAAAAFALDAQGGDGAGLRAFAAARAAEGFPAVSHGAAYREAYAPSYRVVLRRFLPPWITAPPPEAG